MRTRGRVLGSVLLGVLVALATPAVPATAAALADARVTGRIVGLDGEPLAGVPVSVQGTDTGTEFPFFAPIQPPGPVTGTTTGPDGRYALVLRQAYTPEREGDRDWVVQAGGSYDESGAVSSFEFEVNTALQEAPDLPLWRTSPEVRTEGYLTEVAIPAVPDGLAPRLALSGAESSSYATKNGPRASFDLRAHEPVSGFENRPARAYAVAALDAVVRHSEGRTIYHQTVRSATVDVVPALNPVPASRNAPCTFAQLDGSPYPNPCDATDGKRDLVFAHATEPGSDRPPLGSVLVTMQAQTVGSVTVAGCNTNCTVELSADGVAWTAAQDTAVETYSSSLEPDEVLVATFLPAVAAGQIRVGGRGRAIEVVEVSSWPPSPQDSVTKGAPEVGRRDATREASSRRGGLWLAAIVAGLLLVSVAAGAGAAVHRR